MIEALVMNFTPQLLPVETAELDEGDESEPQEAVASSAERQFSLDI